MKTNSPNPPKPMQSRFACLVVTKFRFVVLRNLFAAALAVVAWSEARAVTNIFFNASQTATVISSNINAVTLRSGDYLFTHTVDGYWSSYAGGPPTGRFFSVFWPNGIQAQAITAGPDVGIGANIIIKRVDGKLFDLRAFTGKLLANTAGTGGAFEIMPLLDGEDALNDPLMFDCSGYGGQSFPHTPNLAGYDTYKIHLWVDWALTTLTLIDTNTVVPPANFTIATGVSPADAGTVSGGGVYTNGASVTLTAIPASGFAFTNWTLGGIAAGTNNPVTFDALADHVFVANFTAVVVPVLPPRLVMLLTDTNTVIITWPAASTGFVLQENPDLSTTNWLDASNPVSVVGRNNQVVVPLQGGSDFFRLKLP